jgi:hypothetical protein
MEHMKRFIVFKVACLECFEGDADPAVALNTDDVEEARLFINGYEGGGMSDAFIYDSHTGTTEKADWHR